MLKTILTKSPEIDLTDEMLLFCPRWLRRDVARNIQKHVGPLDAPDALDKLLDLLYSGIPHGWFWSVAERVLNREMMHKELVDKPLDIRTIFDAILSVHARMRDKPRLGAKFPVHYSFTDKLLEWYPDCLLLHTTRNPKAVYASQSKKYLTPEQSWATQATMRFKQFVHINIQITWTARLHKQLRSMPNYRLVRYEEMVADPESQIRGICEFLEIDFLPEMLDPERYGSSFGEAGKIDRGIVSSSVDRWQSSISPLTARIIDTLHPQAANDFGYEG